MKKTYKYRLLGNKPTLSRADEWLLFELRGHKLRGKWTLVKIKRGKEEWLLIKERDADFLLRPM